jgi:hypothetical protein
MADIIKGYKVSYAPYAASAPITGFIELKNCVKSLPNFFPDPDEVDTTTIDKTVKTSIPGLSGGKAYPFKVDVDKDFLTAHAAMVADQIMTEKGSFWLQIEMTNRGKMITFPATTVLQLPTPEGEAGALDEITWNVYMQDDPDVADIA